MPQESEPQESFSRPRLQGGCLCGDVHWKSAASLTLVHYCHCSMCRRWTGGPFATLAWFLRADIDWDGPIGTFRSSPIAVRTHCGAAEPLYPGPAMRATTSP